MVEPTPEQLLRELKDLGDARYKVLTYQLYIEHYVNEIICLNAHEVLHETLRTHLSFPQKIGVLQNKNIVTSEQAEVLKSINSVRNKMVHSLLISQEEIEKMLKDLKLSFKITYEINREKILIDLKEGYAKGFNKIAQFETSATLLVGLLYSKFMFATNRPVEQFFQPVLEKKKDGQWQIVINIMKRVDKRGETKIS